MASTHRRPARERRAPAALAALLASAVLLGGTGSRAAESVVRLQVTVGEAAEIGLAAGQVVSLSVQPARTAQQTLEVPVRANVPWVLRLEASQPPTLPDGRRLVAAVAWSAPGGEGVVGQTSGAVVASGSPTGEGGQSVPLTFRCAAGFDDVPGQYAVDVRLVLAPQL